MTAPAHLIELARRIIHGFHDQAKHHGEMKLILKLCRAGHAER